MSMWFHWTAYTRLLKFRLRPALRMVCISLLTSLIAASGVTLGLATYRDVERMSSEVIMDVFVANTVADSTALSYISGIYTLPGVSHIAFDYGTSVWEDYTDRLRIEGDELGDVVDLPHRLRMVMTSEGTSISRMAQTEDLVRRIIGADVVQVAWSPEQIAQLTQRRKEMQTGMVIGSVLFLLLVIVSVVYSFRAEVHDAGTDLSVGATLGAAPSTSAFPHFLLCTTAAVVGALLASAILYVTRPVVLKSVPWLDTVSLFDAVKVVLVVMAALILEGWLLTYAAARKRARHGKADRAA